MDPASHLALWVALAGSAYLALGAAADLVRWLARVRLPWLPSLRPLLAALTLVTVVGRAAPVGAALPPPAQRLRPDRVAPPSMLVAQDVPVLATPSPVPAAAYQVVPGDTLWGIARTALAAGGATPSAAEVGDYWRAVYAANRDVVGADPDLIHPGQILDLPPRP